MSRFRMPAEWEPHEATWIAWPHERADWPGKFAAIPWIYGEIVRHLARVEIVRILVNDAAAESAARLVLRKCGAALERIEFLHCPTNRSWTRDYCPIFARHARGRLAIIRWHFNGWAKYDNWQFDDAVPPRIAMHTKLPLVETGLVLEGGSIDVNGEGTLLATEECLLSPVQARNPGIGRVQLERAFAKYLGITRVLWLKRGIAGDDTHGHVDDLARFVASGTVVVAAETGRDEANYEPLRENYQLLKRTGLKVVTLPMPEPVWFAGQRLPASYANFYIANGIVLAPVFNDPADRFALNTLARLFPDRRVIGIACTDLVLGLGALHCMTQQQPIAG